MARMPFARYFKRILGEQPDPQLLDAVACIWGEEFIRSLVEQRKTDRVRAFYKMVRRQCGRCEGAVGQHILIDEGEMTTCGTYGIGHVYTGGTIQSACAVVVESATGKRSLAFEISIVRGVTRRAGNFVRRIRGRYTVNWIPRGDRGHGRSSGYGCVYTGRHAGDGDTRDLAARGSVAGNDRSVEEA